MDSRNGLIEDFALTASMSAVVDEQWMQRAIKFARLGEGQVEPNPMVGCVLVKDGKCIAEGYHRRFGQAHAEVDALRSLRSIEDAKGATAYVTLEPCCHFGKTPPCTRAIIEAGISRVVVAMRDPFPKVDGGGLRLLEQAGIQVDVGVCQGLAEELNAPYLKRLATGRPWVIAKWAMSIDGKIATSSGHSQWISNELSRREVHRLRGRVDAIVVGGGTFAADDPLLTARPPGHRVATRIVFAGRRLPSLSSKLMRTIDAAPVMIVANDDSNEVELRALEHAGAELLLLTQGSTAGFPERLPAREKQVDSLLTELGTRQFTNVMVEGGGELLGSFAAVDQIDEIQAYVCPKLIGGKLAPGPLGGQGILSLTDADKFRSVETARFDDDIRITLRRCR